FVADIGLFSKNNVCVLSRLAQPFFVCLFHYKNKHSLSLSGFIDLMLCLPRHPNACMDNSNILAGYFLFNLYNFQMRFGKNNAESKVMRFPDVFSIIPPFAGDINKVRMF